MGIFQGTFPVANNDKLFGTINNDFFIGEPTGYLFDPVTQPQPIPAGNWGTKGGNDTIVASKGSDTIDGGDRIVNAGSKFDCVDYSLWTGPITADLTIKSSPQPAYVDPFGVLVPLVGLVWKGNGQFDTFVAEGYGAAALSSIECIIGTAFHDTLSGDAKANKFFGNDGNDSIKGLAGNDSLDGGNGNDTILGGGDNDTIVGGAGFDTISGGIGADSVDAGADNDTVSGGDGADTLKGGSGNDSVFGEKGNDWISGGEGADTLDGGNNTLTATGDDKIIGNEGNDVIYGRDGNDTLDGDLGSDQVCGGAGNDFLVEANNVTFNAFGTWGLKLGVACSSHGDDGADSQYGGSGADTIAGFDGNDDQYGGTGFDDMYGEGGDDVMCGQAGNDHMSGDAEYIIAPLFADGDDTMSGGSGNDTMFGDEDNDDIYGGSGNDSIDGGTGDDAIFGLTGNDVIVAGSGADYVNAGAGEDKITAGNDNAYDYFYFGCNSLEFAPATEADPFGFTDTIVDLERCDPSDGPELGGIYDVVDVSGIAVALGLEYRVACVTADDCLDVDVEYNPIYTLCEETLILDEKCAGRDSIAPEYKGEDIAAQIEPNFVCLFDALVDGIYYPFGVMTLDNNVDFDNDGDSDDSILQAISTTGDVYTLGFVNECDVHWLNPNDLDNPFLLVA